MNWKHDCNTIFKVNEFIDEAKNMYHLAIFRCESDYSVLLVLTVDDDGTNTRIKALLKDEPRSVKWAELRKEVKDHLRTEVENLIQSISLFLFRTMIDV